MSISSMWKRINVLLSHFHKIHLRLTGSQAHLSLYTGSQFHRLIDSFSLQELKDHIQTPRSCSHICIQQAYFSLIALKTHIGSFQIIPTQAHHVIMYDHLRYGIQFKILVIYNHVFKAHKYICFSTLEHNSINEVMSPLHLACLDQFIVA